MLKNTEMTAAQRAFLRMQELLTQGSAGPNPIESALPVLDALAGFGYNAYVLLDQLTQKYVYVSSNLSRVLGHEREDLMASGLAYALEQMHPEDIEPVLQFNQTLRDMLMALPPEQRLSVRINYDWRLRRRTGGYVRMLQHCFLVQLSPEGLPHLLLAQLIDITHLKPIEHDAASGRPNLILVTEAPGGESLTMLSYGQQVERLSKPLLSPREVEVLTWLDQGLTTRQIAKLLHVSPHTVDTQRRSMLKKTGLVDTTALVSYGRLVGWIRRHEG